MLRGMHHHFFQFTFQCLFIVGSCFALFISNSTRDFVENVHTFYGFVINVYVTHLWRPNGILLGGFQNFFLIHFHLFLIFLNANMNIVDQYVSKNDSWTLKGLRSLFVTKTSSGGSLLQNYVLLSYLSLLSVSNKSWSFGIHF